METLRSMLFEGPVGIYVALSFVWLVLLAAYWYRRTRARAAALALPILIGALVFFLDRAVVTDREQIVAILREIGADAEAGHTDTLERCLDHDYVGFEHGNFDLDRPGAILLARWAIKTYGIERVGFMRMDVQVRREGAWREAQVRLGTLIYFEKSAFGSGRTSLTWQLVWVRRIDGWKIYRISKPESGLGFRGG